MTQVPAKSTAINTTGTEQDTCQRSDRRLRPCGIARDYEETARFIML